MGVTDQTQKVQAVADDPGQTRIAWFAELQLALDAGDLRRALAAQEHLARLGVTVRVGRAGRRART